MQWSQVNNMTYNKLLNLFSKKKVNFTHAVQRREVWDDVRMSDFIYAMIKGYPTISFLAEYKDGTYYVLDGKQRLTTVFKFMTDKFPLYGSKSAKKHARTIGDVELVGKYYKDLPKEIQNSISNYAPMLIQMIEATSDEIKEVFYFLNAKGMQLTPWEITMSQLDNGLKSFTAELQELPFWQKVAITEKEQNRFKFDEIITQVASLVEGYQMDFSGAEMRKYAMTLNAGFPDEFKAGIKSLFEYASKIPFTDAEAKVILKKVHLPVVVFVCKHAIENNVPPEVFHKMLVKAYTALPEDYVKSIQSNTNKYASVKIRERYLDDYVQTAILEWEEKGKEESLFDQPEATATATEQPLSEGDTKGAEALKEVAMTKTDNEVAKENDKQQEQSA